MHENFIKLASKELVDIVEKYSPQFRSRDKKKIADYMAQKAGVAYYLMSVKKCTVQDLIMIFEFSDVSAYKLCDEVRELIFDGAKNSSYKLFYETYSKLLTIDDKEQYWNSYLSGRGRTLDQLKKEVNKKSSRKTKKSRAKVKEELPATPEEVLLDVPPAEEVKPEFEEVDASKYNFEKIMKKRMLALTMLRETWPEVKDNIDFLLTDINAAVTKCLECLNQEYGDLRVRELETKSYSDDFHRKIEVIKKKFDIQVNYYNSITPDEKRTTETAKLTCGEIESLGDEFNKIIDKLF